MRRNLNKKIVIVTGASKGFGLGIARSLRKNGATVYITARNETQLKEAASKIDAIPIVADITIGSDWDNVMNRVTAQSGKLDILINNAGAAFSLTDIDHQEDKVVERTISVNLIGSILGCKRAAAIMKKQRTGLILNMSSICAHEAWPGWSTYGAAKAGLEQFTRHLYVELRPYHIQVTCLTPSWGDTDFSLSAQQTPFNSEIKDKIIKPDEIGDLVCDICSLPKHLAIPQLTLLPLVQEIIPY